MTWTVCLEQLKQELDQRYFDQWIKPLQALEEVNLLRLFAPGEFWIKKIRENKHHTTIENLVKKNSDGRLHTVKWQVGNLNDYLSHQEGKSSASEDTTDGRSKVTVNPSKGLTLDPTFTFENYVAGKSNQFALAASREVANNLGSKNYNPLYIYGPTGLGKTHLMQSIGNEVLKKNPSAKVHCLTSEAFVIDFVKALQKGYIDEFKKFFRSLDVLLIDDFQFIAGKEGSQEEFFHTFNSLFENSRQIVLTSDKSPKEINKLDERLQSRCSWGLAMQVDPPDLETRTAILMKKAELRGISLSQSVALFMAQCVQANVRELEGALTKVVALAEFKKQPLDVNLAKEALRDVLAVRARQINIENIKRVVAEYYRISVRDLTGKKRSRIYARPRQMAMALARELTSKSYPDIGQEFDGRDHTTVIHACRQIDGLKESEPSLAEDYNNLLRSLQA